MARKRDRIFAISVAALFFVSAFGFSFWVIWQAVSNNSSGTTTGSSTSASCTSGTPAAATRTLPSTTPFIPTGAVTKLVVTDLVKGTGKTAASGDCVTVKYYGTLATTGVIFDEDYTAKTAFQFQLGEGQVIPGWDQGLVGMKVGGTRRLVIPSALAYGSESPSSAIPANSSLVFVVYLLAIK